MSPFAPVTGDWHMLLPNEDEVHVPQHRMDLRFKVESGELKGAVLNAEIPLAFASFDGAWLRFQMCTNTEIPQAEMPVMEMKQVNDRFEGAWTRGTERRGPVFKLAQMRR